LVHPAKRVSLFRQLLFIASLCLLGLIASVALLSYRFHRASLHLRQQLNHHQRTVALGSSLVQMIAEERWLILERHRMSASQFSRRMREISMRYETPQLDLLRLRIDPAERALIEDIRRIERDLMVQALHLAHFSRQGTEQREALALVDYQALDRQLRELVGLLQQRQSTTLQNLVAHQNRQSSIWLWLVVGLGLLGVAALSVLALFLQRHIMNPLKNVMMAVTKIREGHFDVPVEGQPQGEMADLAQGVQFMAQHLGQLYASLEQQVAERTEALGQVQTQLLQAEKLAALGQMVTGVAHEVNNPLMVIMGCAELAQLRLGEEQKEISLMLEDIVNQAERCKKTVSSLLQFSRKNPPQKSWNDLNQLIQEVVRLRRYELNTTQIEVETELQADLPAVFLDAHRIQQVLLNLINNAIDSIREKAQAGRILLTSRLVGKWIRVLVQDTGTGIKDTHRIFEPFHTTKAPGKGTGLGLSLCDQILRDHGGRILARNWDEGAEFEILLPLEAGVAQEEGRNKNASRGLSPGAARLALVIDDEQPILEIQGAYLQQLGIASVLIPTVEEALEVLTHQDPDLVISDLRLKGSMDGFSLFEWLKVHRPELLPRLVFISGDLVALHSQSMQHTGCRFLQKPFSFKDLKAVIQEILS
jgi:signal transduction histidine kinase